MTTTSFIVLNTVLAAGVVAGLLRLLVHGIRSDLLDAASAAEPHTVDSEARDQLAA